MPVNIRNNDPCPCGSGVKYKHCCMNKMKKVSLFDAEVVSYPEEFVIGELLRSSGSFKRFYSAERDKIEGPINWIHDLSLPQNPGYRRTLSSEGEKFIRLVRIAAKPEDAFGIAHELGHFALDAEGFPSVWFKAPQDETLCAIVNSMIHDPLVNSRLRVYGLDTQREYEAKVAEWKSQLLAQTNAPSTALELMLWTLLCTARTLNFVASCGQESSDEFGAWFDKRYPDVSEQAQKLLSLVNTIGYDTPVKLSKLFNEITKRYSLQDRIFLQAMPSG